MYLEVPTTAAVERRERRQRDAAGMRDEISHSSGNYHHLNNNRIVAFFPILEIEARGSIPLY